MKKGTTDVLRSNPIDVTVPGDKSVTHRALIFAALAEGQSRLMGLLDAEDTRSTAAALRDLGVDIGDPASEPLMVKGRGLAALRPPNRPLDCGNSGTTARLLLGALAGCPFEAVVTGDASLRRRPMRRITRPLSAYGALFEELDEEGRLPIRVTGARGGAEIEHYNERSSAQVKTAMILAGLTGGTAVTVTESGRCRDHTERMLLAMGAPIHTTTAPEGTVVRIERTEALAPLDMTVPGDFSSAAFFLALGALRGAVRVRAVGLNPTRTGMMDALRRMGAEVWTEAEREEAGEPVGDVAVAKSELRGTTITADEVPTLLDEIPVLAALAATVEGESRFEGVAELRVKESDRIQAMVTNLEALGVETDDGPGHLVVHGTRRPLRGTVDAFGDHRIAMAFGVLAALPGNEIGITGRDVVNISYPTFWKELERVSKEMEDQ